MRGALRGAWDAWSPPVKTCALPARASPPRTRTRLCRERTEAESTPARSCEPAPPPAEAARYRLTNSAGTLLEKRLRSLLARSPEWNDAAERQRLAAVLEAEEAACGDASGAVEVLRSHSCADMRKHAMLRLCHAWRYRSDCWTLRTGGSGERKRTRRPAPAAVEAPPAGKRAALALTAVAEEVLADRTLTVLHAAHAQVHTLLTPLIDAASRAWTGPLSAVQYGRARGEGMTWLRVRSIEGALEVGCWLHSVIHQRLRGLRAWRATLSPEELRAPAYLCDAAYASPECELDALRTIVSHSRASTEHAAELARKPDGGLLAQHAAWVQDFVHGHAAVLSRACPGCESPRSRRRPRLTRAPVAPTRSDLRS